MKKNILIILIIFSLIVFGVYIKKGYTINYKTDKYNIVETYKNKTYLFKIDSDYVFEIYSKRKSNKKQINKIKTYKDKKEECLVLTGSKLEFYPICKNEKGQVAFDLIKSNDIKKKLNISKKKKISQENFEYFNNLDKDTYIAVWKYDGFYIMNGKKIKTLSIFDSERYSNDLSESVNEYIFIPDYDSKHVFNYMYIINMKTGNYKKVKLDNEIDYDSVILGKNNNSIYLYDKKYKVEYEINLKKEKIKIIGNDDKGYVFYKKGKKEKVIWSYLENHKFSFRSINNYKYSGKKSLYKVINDHRIKIFDSSYDYVDQYKNTVYFIDKEYLTIYKPNTGLERIAKNFEWNFNKDKTVFVYNK